MIYRAILRYLLREWFYGNRFDTYHALGRTTDADDGPVSVGTITPNVSSMKNALAITLPNNTTNSRSIVNYDVYVSTDDAFTDVTAVTETNSYTPNNGILVEDMMYYWKVVATDDDGGQTESGVYSFWTNGENSVPSEFTLLTPLTNEEDLLLHLVGRVQLQI